VPIDVSRDHLLQSADGLRRRFPGLQVLPLCVDFTACFPVPQPQRSPARRAVYFPGSTIGNFGPEEATRLLRHIAAVCGPAGGLLIGLDLAKDRDVVLPAYNDAKGITAAFNLNLLARINRELQGDFDTRAFRHQARYNESLNRIEMYLLSLIDQVVHVGETAIPFRAGESICTEYSYKFRLTDFQSLASAAGWKTVAVWNDERQFFSVQYLAVA
jgi:dimethylhistidine N-methyltransferase